MQDLIAWFIHSLIVYCSISLLSASIGEKQMPLTGRKLDVRRSDGREGASWQNLLVFGLSGSWKTFEERDIRLLDWTKTLLILSEVLKGFAKATFFETTLKGLASQVSFLFLKKSEAFFFASIQAHRASVIVRELEAQWKQVILGVILGTQKRANNGGVGGVYSVQTLKGFAFCKLGRPTFYSWSCWLVCSTCMFFLPFTSIVSMVQWFTIGFHVSQVHPLVLGLTATHENWATCQVVDMNRHIIHICKCIHFIYNHKYVSNM